MQAESLARRSIVPACAAWLLLLSLCAALQLHPQGPFDARNDSPVPGMRLVFPLAAAIIEPLAAPIHILAGAPDLRIAGVSALVWLVVISASWRVLADLRTRRPMPFGARALRAAGVAAGSAGLMMVWIACAVLVRVPGWRLEVDDPDTLVVDLHSHTHGSHDGFVSAAENLAWHAADGYNVTAITEHGYPAGAFTAQRYALAAPAPTPAVITGEEFSFFRRGGHLLSLGLKADYKSPTGKGEPDFPSRFASYVHQEQGGAMIAMGYKLHPEEAMLLADAGIDAFEIANFGHPNLKPKVREAMLEAARKRGVALVASSDWHGWGGLSRTWTVIHAAGAGAASQAEKADLVVQKLRARGSADIIPVVAGHIGPPPKWRAIFAPFVEILRYAAELSLPRVVSWWLWLAAVLVLARGFTRIGVPAGKALLTILLSIISTGLLWRGLLLVQVKPDGLNVSDFSRFVGTCSLLAGVSVLVAAIWHVFVCRTASARKRAASLG
jgi:histidinol phosphatase-like PHP family hydrolase